MVPLIGQPLLYLVAVLAGTAVTAALVVLLKGLRKTAAPAVAAPEATAVAGEPAGV